MASRRTPSLSTTRITCCMLLLLSRFRPALWERGTSVQRRRADQALCFTALLALDQDQQVANAGHQLERHLFKGVVAFLFWSLYSSRVGKTPMHALGVSGKGGAGLPYAIANRYNVIEGLVAKLVQMLRSLLFDVEAHGLEG